MLTQRMSSLIRPRRRHRSRRRRAFRPAGAGAANKHNERQRAHHRRCGSHARIPPRAVDGKAPARVVNRAKQLFGRFRVAASRRSRPRMCKGPGGRRGLCGGNYPPGWGKPGDQTKKEESLPEVGAAQRLVNTNLHGPAIGLFALEIRPLAAVWHARARSRSYAAGLTRSDAAAGCALGCTTSVSAPS